MYRAMGSLAFVAAARAAWAVTADPDDQNRRLLLPLKNNLAADTGGLAYRLDATGSATGTPALAWEADPVDISADEALAPDRDRPGPEADERREAERWLKGALAGVCRTAGDVLEEGRNGEGFSKSTIDRAGKNLKVQTRRRGFGKGAVWWWQLPASMDTRTPPYTSRT